MPVTYQKATSDAHLKVVMERISELLGKTVVVHSGDRDYVPPGGSTTSLHLAHRAVDFHVPELSDSFMLDKIRANYSRLLDKTEGYELIRHGDYTETGGPHLHLGHFAGAHAGKVLLKFEGLTPSTKGSYSLETITIGDGKPIKTPSGQPPIIPGAFQSVGEGGINQMADVRKVQDLLNLARQRLITGGIRFEQFKRLKEDGIIGSKTIGAIRIFQRDIAGFPNPDGRIDPGGRTMQVLQKIASGDLSSLNQNIHIAKTIPTTSGNSSLTKDSASETLADDPRIKAFLDVLGFTEGTGTNYGKVVNGRVISAPYNPELVGKYNVSVTNLNRHPEILVQVNASIKSTAAGRYQFLGSTWEELNMPDFTARSQDVGAVKLMKRRKMIEPLLGGNLRSAVTNGAPEWASLPTAGGGSYYGGQPSRTFEEITTEYNSALQRYQQN
jgi:muramidase (phage lysozyme)